MDSPGGSPLLAAEVPGGEPAPAASAAGRLEAPLRFAGGSLLTFLVRVPLHAIAFGVALFLGAQVLRFSAGAEGLLAGVGLWTVALALGLLGVVTGAVAGGVSAAGHAADRLQAGLAEWLLALPAGPGSEVLPPMPLEEARATYDRILDAMFDSTLGRVPLPGPVRRLLRRPFRQAVVEDFLEDCHRRELESVGYPELRNWLLARGLPWLMAPFRCQLRLWRALSRGVAGLALAVTLGLALLAGRMEPRATIMVLSFTLALATLVAAFTTAGRHASPFRWRLGMAALAACLGLWPWVYLRLWPLAPGLLWIPVVAVTLVTVRWALRQAFLRADPPSAGPE
jgi:hypothetical protein